MFFINVSIVFFILVELYFLDPDLFACLTKQILCSTLQILIKISFLRFLARVHSWEFCLAARAAAVLHRARRITRASFA